MYSSEFKQTVKEEIKRLQDAHRSLNMQIEALTILLGEGELLGASKPQKRAYKKRLKETKEPLEAKNNGRARSDTRGVSLDELLAMDTSKMTATELHKHQKAIANKKYRMGMSTAKNPGKFGRGLKVQTNNRFTLDRDFDLGDKDVSLIISYLISWKGTGRLNASENLALDAIQGIARTNLSDVQKSNLREAFYSARIRVLDKSRSTSED